MIPSLSDWPQCLVGQVPRCTAQVSVSDAGPLEGHG